MVEAKAYEKILSYRGGGSTLLAGQGKVQAAAGLCRNFPLDDPYPAIFFRARANPGAAAWMTCSDTQKARRK
jgi:hypothetical protein